jgi:hypothetical protein
MVSDLGLPAVNPTVVTPHGETLRCQVSNSLDIFVSETLLLIYVILSLWAKPGIGSWFVSTHVGY